MNALWIDIKYASIIAPRMDRYVLRDASNYKAQFRCPYCGDSKKSKSKARGWLYLHENTIWYKCFNCQKSCHLSTFISDQDNQLFTEYRLESFKENTDYIPPVKEVKNYKTSFNGLIKLSELEPEHSARKYLETRKLPIDSFDRIYYTDTFFSWINSIIPDKFDSKHDEGRIIFPLIHNNKLTGVNARVLPTSTNKTRYITIKFKDDSPKIFGLEKLDPTKEFFVVEGPIDSLFLPNSIAMVGTDTNLEQFVNKNNAILVLDNENRNKEVVDRYNKYINQNFRICIWPSEFKEKDINDFILSGFSSDDVVNLILSNTYSGLDARLMFTKWRKV